MAAKWQTPELVAEQDSLYAVLAAHIDEINAAWQQARANRQADFEDQLSRAEGFVRSRTTTPTFYLSPGLGAATLEAVRTIAAKIQAGSLNSPEAARPEPRWARIDTTGR